MSAKRGLIWGTKRCIGDEVEAENVSSFLKKFGREEEKRNTW